ncbi:MAG: hypothetical protein RI942_2613, partial [Pseudomonadota bacterium]
MGFDGYDANKLGSTLDARRHIMGALLACDCGYNAHLTDQNSRGAGHRQPRQSSRVAAIV